MDINHPPAKARHRLRRHELEVSGEDDEVAAFEGAEQLGGVGGIAQHRRGHAGVPGPFQGAGVASIGDDAGDNNRGGVSGRPGEGVQQRLQVRAAARNEDGDTHRGH